MARRLTTIVATDIVGYSRLMGANEAGTLATIKSHRAEILEPLLARSGGRVVKYMGDGGLLEFESVVDAVRFTVQMQLALDVRNAKLPEDQRVIYRIGVNIGDVIVDGDDIYGDGVNVASRLEGIAQPGGICVSRTVRSHVSGKLDLEFEELGERRVKNIAAPVSVYRVILNDKAKALLAAGPSPELVPGRRRQPIALAVIVLALLAGGLGWWQLWTPGRSAHPATDINLAAQPNRLAVLPFRNISDDPEQDYFAMGLAEDLIADLTTIRGLAVIARTSSFQVGENPGRSQDIANQLGARYFIGGSVRRARDTLRISVDLVDASTGTTIWAERFDGSDDDVFEFQDRILAQIVNALDIVLAPAQIDALQTGKTKSPKAYEAYLQGLNAVSELKHIDIEGNTLASDAFERAIRVDPGFAEAYAGLAWANWLHYATINYYSFEHRDRAFASSSSRSRLLKPRWRIARWPSAITGFLGPATSLAAMTSIRQPKSCEQPWRWSRATQTCWRISRACWHWGTAQRRVCGRSIQPFR